MTNASVSRSVLGLSRTDFHDLPSFRHIEVALMAPREPRGSFGGTFFSAGNCFELSKVGTRPNDPLPEQGLHGVGSFCEACPRNGAFRPCRIEIRGDPVKDEFENMAARARRGGLDRSERRQLRVVLRNSLEARVLYRAGCKFDALDNIQPGDETLTERITRRVLKARRGSGHQGTR